MTTTFPTEIEMTKYEFTEVEYCRRWKNDYNDSCIWYDADGDHKWHYHKYVGGSAGYRDMIFDTFEDLRDEQLVEEDPDPIGTLSGVFEEHGFLPTNNDPDTVTWVSEEGYKIIPERDNHSWLVIEGPETREFEIFKEVYEYLDRKYLS